MSTAPQPRLAFDIETINAEIPDDVRRDFKNSEHVELFCICAAYQPEPGKEVEHEVFFREKPTPEAELDVIDETIRWLDSKPGSSVITYNGNSFDIPHMEGRARIAADALEGGDRYEVPERVDAFFERSASVDLYERCCDALDDTPRFEAACEHFDIAVPETPLEEYEIGVDPIPHRPTSRGIDPVFKGCDVPVIGERYLNFAKIGATDKPEFQAMHAALEHYATTDVTPLFELADRVPIPEAA